MKKCKTVKTAAQQNMLPYNLTDLLSYYPIREDVAFKAARVHRTTWRRWLNGESNPPTATVQLIRSLAIGALPDPEFNGFSCHSGLIFDDTNTGYTPADIRSIPFFRAGHLRYVDALRQIDELKKSVDALTSHAQKQALIK